MDNFRDKKIIDIPIDQLQANPLQPRGVITAESVKDLVDSIREHGILEPLVVAHTPAGYQIITGERRWRASKIAQLQTVPCIVKETSPRGMLEMALVENVQREDLNALDRAKAFERLVEEFGLTKTEVAKRIGKSAPYISNTLKLLELPDAIKDGLLSGLISEGHARALQGISDPRLMIEAYKMILKESGSVRRAEEIARRMKAASGQPSASTFKNRNNADDFFISDKIDRIESEIRERFGKKVRVKLKQSLRQTKLQLVLLGKPEETNTLLEQIHRALMEISPNLPGGQ